MKRQNVLTTTLIASAFLALMTLTACDAQKSLNPDEQTIDLESSEFAIYEYEDEMAGIQDASMENDMAVSDADPQDHRSTEPTMGIEFFQRLPVEITRFARVKMRMAE